MDRVGDERNGMSIYCCFANGQYAITGQAFQQWWFLRDGETGYHSFTRLTFDNGTEGIDLGNVQEVGLRYKAVADSSSGKLYVHHWSQSPF